MQLSQFVLSDVTIRSVRATVLRSVLIFSRLDMLLLLAEYAIDMTEKQMIALLLHVITLPNIVSTLYSRSYKILREVI